MGNSLVTAARDGDLDRVNKCVADPKCNINHQDNEHGVTALMEASHAGHLKVLSFLISHKADVNLTSKHGVPAVVYAATQNQAAAVQFLVAHGADPKPVNFIKKEIKFDFPAIQEAIKKGLESRATGQVYWIHHESAPNLVQPATNTDIHNKTPTGTPPPSPLPTQGSPPLQRQHSIIVKPNQLKTTTAVLKNEVEKLKAFMSSAGAIQEELDQLRIDHENLQSEVEKKNASIIDLSSKLAMAQLNASTGGTGKVEQAPEWMKEKMSLMQENKSLTAEVQSLKDIQKRFAAAVLEMRQENDELKAKLRVYTGSDDEEEEMDEAENENA